MKNATLADMFIPLRCATVANAEVSSGIVGYQTLTIPQGYSMYCVTFKGIGDTSYDCTNIKLLNSAGKEMNDDNTTSPSQRSRNKVVFQLLDSTTGNVTDTPYRYNSQSGKGWCEVSTPLTEGQMMLQPGQSFYLNNTQGDTVYLQFPTLVNE